MAKDTVSLPPQDVELLVCVTCRRPGLDPEGERPGARLLETLSREDMPHGVRVTPVSCLQNCESGCTVALRGGDRWTYVFGNLDETAQTAMLIDGAARYRDAPDGLIPWRERPEHFKRNCVARIPPPTPSGETHD